jgi:ubiquinone/menaquinone biosynthesis C-methylase UbiE
MDLSKQYDQFAEDFSRIHDAGENSNRDNRKVFYDQLDFIKPGVKLLDLACGDGLDLVYYRKLGAEVYGLDASEKLIDIAKQRLPDADIRIGTFEKLPYEDNYFDVILSKYAIQTSENLNPVFQEIYRVLKPGGILMYLVTHPFRQFLEKKEGKTDYFEQKIVQSRILNDAIVVEEPSHTLNEYLTSEFLKNFDIRFYGEFWDAAAEQIEGKKYPGYFILKAIKR